MKQALHTPLTDEYLQSLQGLQPAEPDPYFYTRLRARMEKAAAPSGSFLLRPVLAVAALSIVLLVNTFTILQQKNSKQQPEEPVGNTATIEDFTREFNINTGANY
jgi:hypothetical protein